MAPRQLRISKIIEDPHSDSDSSELSYVSDESWSRAASKEASKSKIKGTGKQVESASSAASKKVKTSNGEGAAAEIKKKQQGLSMLFSMPLDILAEVCSHLPSRDLINVCRTSKSFRTFLLSRQSRSVWIASRAQAGFPALQHIQLSPIQYVLHLFGNGLCEVCHVSRADPTYALMIRQCKDCRKEILVIKGNNLKRELPDLHPRALECAPHPEIKSYRNAWRVGKEMWRKDHLMEASDKLEELEAEDAKETDERRILELRAKGGGRNTRRANNAVTEGLDLNTPHTDRVGTYVAEQRMWAEGCVKEEAQIWKVFDNERAEQARLMREIIVRRNAAEAAKQQQICDDLFAIGWTRAEVNGWTKFGGPLTSRFGESPKADKKGWEAAKKLVNDRLAEEAARTLKLAEKQALRGRQSQRQDLLAPYYDTLLEAEPDESINTFPRLDTFLHLPSVKAFWQLDEDDGGKNVTPKSWKNSLKVVKQDIKASVDKFRVDIIRSILAASRDVDISTLSTKPHKYPTSVYDDKFFKKITSAFIRTDWTWPGGHTVDYYPHYLAPSDLFPIVVRTSPLRISTLRAILEAAELDEETATEDDLDKLGARFRWLEYPVYKKSKTVWTWKDLIIQVERRKSNKRSKNRNLGVTIVLDEAIEGSAQKQPAYDGDEDEEMMDESGDEEDEEAGDSEADSFSAPRRRRRHRGDTDEDEDDGYLQRGEEEDEMDMGKQEGEGDELGDGDGDDELDSDEE